MVKLITSVRVIRGVSHDTVIVWNRGGLAGKLTVLAGDGYSIALRIQSGDSSPIEVVPLEGSPETSIPPEAPPPDVAANLEECWDALKKHPMGST